jgi:hypothetical protein
VRIVEFMVTGPYSANQSAAGTSDVIQVGADYGVSDYSQNQAVDVNSTNFKRSGVVHLKRSFSNSFRGILGGWVMANRTSVMPESNPAKKHSHFPASAKGKLTKTISGQSPTQAFLYFIVVNPLLG